MKMDEFRLAEGDKAPGYELQNQDGETLKFSALAGKKAIVYFYPAASTPGCTKEACEFEENLGPLEEAGYTVVGISPDAPAKLKKFQTSQDLHFELLSDPDMTVHKAWGAFGTKSLYGRIYKGVIRSTFVIDEKGKITLALYNVKATGHVQMLRGKLGI
jgi:peroxiredoxin Q/BCP